jgi:hypothetical protein
MIIVNVHLVLGFSKCFIHVDLLTSVNKSEVSAIITSIL